jgi:hypothetical protein
VRFDVSAVFTPTRGVVHPSFPLRGRWERIAKSDERAPSPSLASLLNSSCETHSWAFLLHGQRQCPPWAEFLASLSLANTCLNGRITHTAPNPAFEFSLELFKTCFGSETSPARCFTSSTELQYLGNTIFRLPLYRFCRALPADLTYAHAPRQPVSSAYS